MAYVETVTLHTEQRYVCFNCERCNLYILLSVMNSVDYSQMSIGIYTLAYYKVQQQLSILGSTSSVQNVIIKGLGCYAVNTGTQIY